MWLWKRERERGWAPNTTTSDLGLCESLCVGGMSHCEDVFFFSLFFFNNKIWKKKERKKEGELKKKKFSSSSSSSASSRGQFLIFLSSWGLKTKTKKEGRWQGALRKKRKKKKKEGGGGGRFFQGLHSHHRHHHHSLFFDHGVSERERETGLHGGTKFHINIFFIKINYIYKAPQQQQQHRQLASKPASNSSRSNGGRGWNSL